MIIALCFGAEQSYAFIAQENSLETVFRRNLHTDTVHETVSRSSSFDDLAHVAKVEGQDKGLSLESLASRLTLFRYDMERLAANNPRAYEALMKAWDLRAQAALTMGAASALASAPETFGMSLLTFGASLGAGIGLDYIADLFTKYGAKIIANNACNDDPRLKTSYEKTFAYVGALVGQHGIRAAAKRIGHVIENNPSREAQRKVGNAGKYGKLTKPSGFNDNMDAHHMPSKKYIESHGMHRDDGFSAMMTKEQHKQTRTYGRKGATIDTSAPYRSEIGRDLNEYINILKTDGSWTPEVRRSLMKGLDNFKQEFPELFRKVTK